MARPKAGTKAGDIATEKWRKTMLEKYGSKEALRKRFQEMGSLGGQHGFTGGFYAHPEKAKEAGRKGGRISRRGESQQTKMKLEANATEIEKLYYFGVSLPKIAKKLDIPYGALLRWAKRSLEGYGVYDDIDRYEKILEYEERANGRD